MARGDRGTYFAVSSDKPVDAALLNIRLRDYRGEEDANRQGGAYYIDQLPLHNAQPLTASGSENIDVHQGSGYIYDQIDIQNPQQQAARTNVHVRQGCASFDAAVGDNTPHQRAIQNQQQQASGGVNVGLLQAENLVQIKKSILVIFAVRHGVSGTQSLSLRLDVSTPLWQLKNTLETSTGIPACSQAWFQGDQELWNMDTLDGRNIQENSVIQIDNTDITN